MVSAYAQCGKLFEEVKTKSVHIPSRFKTQFAAIGRAERQQALTKSKRGDSQKTSDAQDSSKCQEVSWLNRISRKACFEPKPNGASCPGTIECVEGIQMSQMTDDFSSKHIDDTEFAMQTKSVSAKPRRQQILADWKCRPDAFGTLHRRQTPMEKTPESSRGRYRAAPLEDLYLARTPHSEASIVSSRTPYQPRSGNKRKERSLIERFGPCKHFKAFPFITPKQESSTMVSLLKPSPGNEVATNHFYRFKTDPDIEEVSAASLSKASTANTGDGSGRRHSNVLKASPDPLLHDQMKVLDTKTAFVQKMLGDTIAEITAHKTSAIEDVIMKIAERKRSVLTELDEIIDSKRSALSDIESKIIESTRSAFTGIDAEITEAKTSVLRDIGAELNDRKRLALREIDMNITDSRKSAICEIETVKGICMHQLNDQGNEKAEQLRTEAMELRMEHENNAKRFFEKQRLHLINSCLPFLQQKASSILQSMVDCPAFFARLKKTFNLGTATLDIGRGRSQENQVGSTSMEKRERKPRVVLPTRTSLAKGRTLLASEHAMMTPPRRSKRLSLKRSYSSPSFPSIVAKKKRSIGVIMSKSKPNNAKASSVVTEKTAEDTMSVELNEVILPVIESSQMSEPLPGHIQTDPCATMHHVPFEKYTSKPRVRMFGRSETRIAGVNISPERSYFVSRKKPKIEDTPLSVNITDAEESIACLHQKTANASILRRRTDLRTKLQSQNRSPVLIEDEFNFNFSELARS